MDEITEKVDYQSSSGGIFQILLSDDGEKIYVTHHDLEVGSLSLRFFEGEAQYTNDDHFHITHLELDSCKRMGIGRRCLQFHKEIFNAPITAGNAFDGEKEDGSHLIGNGIPFIAKMREEGIVSHDQYSTNQYTNVY